MNCRLENWIWLCDCGYHQLVNSWTERRIARWVKGNKERQCIKLLQILIRYSLKWSLRELLTIYYTIQAMEDEGLLKTFADCSEQGKTSSNHIGIQLDIWELIQNPMSDESWFQLHNASSTVVIWQKTASEHGSHMHKYNRSSWWGFCYGLTRFGPFNLCGMS